MHHVIRYYFEVRTTRGFGKAKYSIVAEKETVGWGFKVKRLAGEDYCEVKDTSKEPDEVDLVLSAFSEGFSAGRSAT